MRLFRIELKLVLVRPYLPEEVALVTQFSWREKPSYVCKSIGPTTTRGSIPELMRSISLSLTFWHQEPVSPAKVRRGVSRFNFRKLCHFRFEIERSIKTKYKQTSERSPKESPVILQPGKYQDSIQFLTILQGGPFSLGNIPFC